VLIKKRLVAVNPPVPTHPPILGYASVKLPVTQMPEPLICNSTTLDFYDRINSNVSHRLVRPNIARHEFGCYA